MSAIAQNLLINGDFEASVPDGKTPKIGWKFDWSPDESGAVTTSTAARTGNCGLWIYTAQSGSNSFTKSFQEVPCRPSTNYRAEIYLRTPENQGWIPGSSAYITLTFKSSSGVTLYRVSSDKLNSVNNEWRLFSFNVLAPERSALVRYTIHLESKKGQSVCNADNCSLTVVR
ncbi:MAG TPA: hypothetical protein DDW27_16885 [Bacteroidales bacterium]|nr:hypothetical protein [Bacteroidales bacterium]